MAHLMASQNFICQDKVASFTTCKGRRDKILSEAEHIHTWLSWWRIICGIPGRRAGWEAKQEFVSVEGSGGFRTRKQHSLYCPVLPDHTHGEGERGEKRATGIGCDLCNQGATDIDCDLCNQGGYIIKVQEWLSGERSRFILPLTILKLQINHLNSLCHRFCSSKYPLKI